MSRAVSYKIKTGFVAILMAGSAAEPAWAEEVDLITAEELRAMFLGDDVGVDTFTTGAIPKVDEVNKYCIGIFNEAKEARHAVLTNRLKKMKTSVNEKLDEMEIRITELREWTEKREQFLSQAKDSLIQIFQSMRPDAAASQLTEMGPVMSAAIIAKLDPKISSAILSEMDAEDAAKITLVLTDAVGLDE